jgi:hypothetical protein
MVPFEPHFDMESGYKQHRQCLIGFENNESQGDCSNKGATMGWSMKTSSRKSTGISVFTTMWLLLLILLTLTTSGCTSQPELDTSLLTDDPCSAPCWHSITPGLSSEDDVRGILEGSPFVRENTLGLDLTEQRGVPLTMFSWQGQGEDLNRIYLRDGQVLRIEINLDYELTLDTVVEKYGQPDSVYAYVRCTEFFGYLVFFDYPTQGLRFSSFSYPVNRDDVVVREGIGLLSGDLIVNEVIYYAPTSPQNMLSEVFLLPADGVEYYLTNMQEWQGFGYVRLAE